MHTSKQIVCSTWAFPLLCSIYYIACSFTCAFFSASTFNVNVVIFPFRRAARTTQRYENKTLCKMIALLSINFGIFYLDMLLRKDDFSILFLLLLPLLFFSAHDVPYRKLWDHVASYDSLPTTKVARMRAKLLACVCALAVLSRFPSFLLVPFSQNFFSKLDVFQTTEHAFHVERQRTGHNSYNTCMYSFKYARLARTRAQP